MDIALIKLRETLQNQNLFKLRLILITLVAFFIFNSDIVGQNTFPDFFRDADLFFKDHVKDGLVDYKKLSKNSEALDALIATLGKLKDDGQSDDIKKAYRINAYNLLVIKKVVQHYPISSVQKINLFFDKKDVNFGGQKLSLNALEKSLLFDEFKDNRLHFVLVCAAASCPPLISEAYFPERIEQQLAERTNAVLNDPNFVKYDAVSNRLEISEIFKWYAKDFGDKKAVPQFIQQYYQGTISPTATISYAPYSWALNDNIKTAIYRQYTASTLLPKKGIELKVFNALYTQRKFEGFEKLNSRSTYFSIFNQFLYGIHPKVNAGIDFVFKSNVVNDFASSSPFKTLAFQNKTEFQSFDCPGEHHANSLCKNDVTGSRLRDTLRNYEGQPVQTESRIGLSHIGPKVRFNPFKKWQSNLSLQQTFYIPVNKSVDGQFISFTQFFYDKTLSPRTQLFVELSFWVPFAPEFKPLYPFAKAFFSYFPSEKSSIYVMTTVPFEYGIGTKYRIAPRIELEFLATWYVPLPAINNGARANTFNFGVIYN